MKLRDYQRECITKIITNFQSGDCSIILQLPTGAGKTAIALTVAQDEMFAATDIAIVVPRVEIANQFLERVSLFADSISEDFRNPARFYIERVQALFKLRDKYPNIGLVIVDEVDSFKSDNQFGQIIFRLFPNAKVLGLSATPVDDEGQGFNSTFDRMVTGPSVRTLIKDGYLSPFIMYCPPYPSQLPDLLKAWQRYSKQKQTIIFAQSRHQSVQIAEYFNSVGVVSAHIDYETKELDRASIINGFKEGSINVLTNFKLLCKGVDLPNVACIMSLREMRSLVEDKQVWGRGLRVYSGKKFVTFVSFRPLYHGLPDHPISWDLYGYQILPSTPIVTCSACYCVHRLNKPCPSCGLNSTKNS